MKETFRLICDICGIDCSPNGENVLCHTSGPFVICDKDFTEPNKKTINEKYRQLLDAGAAAEKGKP